MKKIVLLNVLMILICFSCVQKEPSKLVGEYAVGKFEMQPEYNLKKLNKLGLLKKMKGTIVFTNDKIHITPILGDLVFGGADFEYELTDKTLVLKSSDKTKELNYMFNEKVLYIFLKNNKYFSRVDLLPKNNLKNK